MLALLLSILVVRIVGEVAIVHTPLRRTPIVIALARTVRLVASPTSYTMRAPIPVRKMRDFMFCNLSRRRLCGLPEHSGRLRFLLLGRVFDVGHHLVVLIAIRGVCRLFGQTACNRWRIASLSLQFRISYCDPCIVARRPSISPLSLRPYG